jgi:uncharacterized protein (DUF1697 family)
MTRHIALLRGINVGGHRKVPMAELRALASSAGFGDVRTYVASGNLVLSSDNQPATIETTLEQAIEARFGFAVDVVVRTAVQWADYLLDNPFETEGASEPNFVMLCIGKRPATDADLAGIRASASGRERAERRGDALWLYFADGSARSKMSLGPRAGVWTTRNLRSVRQIAALLG